LDLEKVPVFALTSNSSGNNVLIVVTNAQKTSESAQWGLAERETASPFLFWRRKGKGSLKAPFFIIGK